MRQAPDINAEQVICGPLPKLIIGKFGTQTITTPSMKFLYRGPLAKWDGFLEDIGIFLEALKPGFVRCQDIGLDKSQNVAHVNPHYVTGELLQVGSEIDMDGRFKHNVCAKLIGVLRTLHDPEFANGKAPTDLPHLPDKIDFGSNKVYNFANKPVGSEPDVIFKIPGMGERRQEVRLLCELKSPSVVRISDITGTAVSTTLCTRHSFRNVIGQVVRDMLAWRLKYGAVSTYDETVFLKIDQSRSRPGEWRVYYTKIVNSTDKVHVHSNGKIGTTSTRLAFLYLLHRVTDEVREHWKLPADLKPLQSKDWIEEKFDDEPCPDVTPQSDTATYISATTGVATLNLGPSMNIQDTPIRNTGKHPLDLIQSPTEEEDGGDESTDGDEETDVSLFEPKGRQNPSTPALPPRSLRFRK